MTNHIEVPDGAWVVIADGTGARYYKASVDGGAVSLAEIEAQGPERLLDDGPAGKRPPDQTASQTDEATFTKQLANALYAHAHAGRFEQLVLIADPQSLGQIRGSLHQEVKDRMHAEIAKTMTTMPLREIEKALSRR